jgi:OmcA/MtrC family decaheme c-type cytochrome
MCPDGSYTYSFAKNISAVVVAGTPVTYERNRVHRVSVMMGGHSGATADASFDFVPDGSTPAVPTRAIVATAACKACHGEEFHGHGGDRLSVDNCATCHVPGTFDANGGESLDLKVMIHKIHAGGELPTLAGADGILWDNPATTVNEAADNAEYAIWGNGNTKHTWWKAEFPAVLANCKKCHQGIGADVDSWKTKPSRAACGSCHDDVNFETGENHDGGPYADDASCTTCHPSSGAAAWPVTEAHDWIANFGSTRFRYSTDLRKVPEFDVSLTVSAPANGTHFVKGEAPVVTIVLKDVTSGQPIDHTTVVEGPAEGCTPTACPKGDGRFAGASLFVSGPRASRKPVLTTSARAQVLSATTGPWDLSAAGAGLSLKVDNGQDIVLTNVTGGDYLAPSSITVAFPATSFATPTQASAAEIVGRERRSARPVEAPIRGGRTLRQAPW